MGQNNAFNNFFELYKILYFVNRQEKLSLHGVSYSKKSNYMKFKLLSLAVLSVALLGVTNKSQAQSTTPPPPSAPATAQPLRAIPEYRDVVADSSKLTKKGKAQQIKFDSFTYLMPPKPRNQWEVGLGVGPAYESSDVRARLGYGGMAYVRKSIGYTFSLRARFDYSRDYGLNYEPSEGLANNTVLTHLGYGKAANPYFFYNYKANLYDGDIDGIITLNNIGFHKVAKDRKWNLYGIFGVGAVGYNVWYNALDKNGKPYNYSAILAKYGGGIYEQKNAAKIKKDLKSLMDNTYETKAQGQVDHPKVDPTVTAGFAIGYHINTRFTLTAEYKFVNTRDNLLDGLQWQEHPLTDPALSNHWDAYHMATINVGYNLGRHAVEPLYWQNPMEYSFDAIKTIQKQNADLLLDDDGDGVPNRFDLEPNTPKGATVDSHGRTLDSDHDGIPDYLDKEPFTAANWFPVDKDGYGTNGLHYGKNGPDNLLAIGGGAGKLDYCKLTKMPDVNFDLDRYYIKPEFYSGLHEIALAMIACPDQKMVAIGYTDVRETEDYNMVLSWNRVNKVIDYLTSNYGISRDRFIVKFEGKSNPRIPGLPSNSWDPKYEPRQYVNRRVEFHWAAKGETGTSNPARPKGPTNAGRDY